MIRARSSLIRQLQEFFEKAPDGPYKWADVTLRPPEKAEKIVGYRQEDKEIATVDFGVYALQLSSPNQEPPLGRIVLFNLDRGMLVDGPADSVTWDAAARAIKESERNLSDVG
jgi:hypothetical protein